MNICLVGTGSFGTTMAVVLANNMQRRNAGSTLHMYVRRQDLYDHLVRHRFRPDFPGLEDVLIPKNVSFTMSLQEALSEATHCVFAVPSSFAETVLKKMAPHFPGNCKILSLVKGFHFDKRNASFLRMSTLIAKVLEVQPDNVCSLGGPNIYQELALNYARTKRIHRPCTAVISSANLSIAKEFQKMYFSRDIFRTYHSDSVVASEVCGALKNVYAISAGASDGHRGGGMGVSFKASLLTRAANEMSFLVRALGARAENAYGLAGMGDLIATCTRGRNWKAGKKLVSGQTVTQVQQEMKPNVLEGLQTLSVLNDWFHLLRDSNPHLCLELPIFNVTYKFVYEGLRYEDGVNEVINRPMKKEMRTDPYVLVS